MGRRTKPGLSLHNDADEGYAALGFASEMTKQINTDRYLSSVLKLTHSVMNREFQAFIDASALANPERYRHLYEPGKTGISEFALWRTTLRGNKGSNKEVSFEWAISKLPILTPEQRKNEPGDAMQYVPDEVIAKLSDRRYVFKMQAPIMEYGLRVNIQPVYSKFLFIPTVGVNYLRDRKSGTSTPTHYRFAKYNVPEWSYRNPQEPSGKGGTQGQFTQAWLVFWNGGPAEAVWDQEIAPRIEKSLDEADRKISLSARKVRKSTTTITLQTFANTKAAKKKAMESGANLARAFIRGKARSYAQAAEHIDRNGYFGGEREY